VRKIGLNIPDLFWHSGGDAAAMLKHEKLIRGYFEQGDINSAFSALELANYTTWETEQSGDNFFECILLVGSAQARRAQ
jgi:hypothetical protein